MFFLISAIFLIFLAACNDNSQEDNNAEANDEESNESSEAETKTFTTDSGDEVEVPADPERIVVLHPTYIGALLKFGHEPVGVSFYVDQDEVLNEATEGIERIDPEDVESIINLEPDLIVATATDPNLNKLQQIAPTITFDSMISTYKDNTKLLGELVGEEDQAQAWLDEWEEQMAQDTEEYKDLIGDSTLSIFQSTPKGWFHLIQIMAAVEKYYTMATGLYSRKRWQKSQKINLMWSCLRKSFQSTPVIL